MSDNIIERFSKEWGTITAAPRSFITAVAIVVVLAVGGVWFLMDLKYGGAISAKDGTIETLKSQIEGYKNKLNGASPDEAKARIENLENKLAQLEPRRLTGPQRESFIANARSPVGVTFALDILEDGLCPDCNRYAAEIASALAAAGGWNIRQPMGFGIAQKSPKGITLKVPDPARMPDAATVLAVALRAGNMALDILAAPVPRNAEVELVVSARIISP